MSWEVFGSDEPFDVDILYRHDWESDEGCEKWWKAGEPEEIYTLGEAIRAYEDWMYAED